MKKLEHGADLELPLYATEGSSGMDLRAAIEKSLIIKPGERFLVPCGFSMAIPKGLEAQLRPRSGLAYKNGITLLNAPGTIDSDYRGEIKVLLINFGTENFTVKRGMRIAQMIIAPYVTCHIQQVSNFEETTSQGRSLSGFGSTGLS